MTTAILSQSPGSSRLWRDAWRRLWRDPLGLVGLLIVAILVIAALIGPFLTPYGFLDQDLALRSNPPSLQHWFGTDDLGRDVLSRVIYGSRTAVLVALGVTALSVAIGVGLGALAGYAGGVTDRAIMWLADVTMSIPGLLLVIVLNTSLKPPLTGLMDYAFSLSKWSMFRNVSIVDIGLVLFSIALLKWPQYARLVRGQVLVVRASNYVLAAEALGLSRRLIITTAIIPNILGPVIVSVSFGLGTAMVLESSFSFLGVGIEPPIPSWGRMISDGLRVWNTSPHLLALPALVLAFATVGFAFLGDALNDALDPKGD